VTTSVLVLVEQEDVARTETADIAVAEVQLEHALYTDLSNPTSNAIYQTIGYRVDHDAEERSFDL
jgi:hypothetical protein